MGAELFPSCTTTTNFSHTYPLRTPKKKKSSHDLIRVIDRKGITNWDDLEQILTQWRNILKKESSDSLFGGGIKLQKIKIISQMIQEIQNKIKENADIKLFTYVGNLLPDSEKTESTKILFQGNSSRTKELFNHLNGALLKDSSFVPMDVLSGKQCFNVISNIHSCGNEELFRLLATSKQITTLQTKKFVERNRYCKDKININPLLKKIFRIIKEENGMDDKEIIKLFQSIQIEEVNKFINQKGDHYQISIPGLKAINAKIEELYKNSFIKKAPLKLEILQTQVVEQLREAKKHSSQAKRILRALSLTFPSVGMAVSITMILLFHSIISPFFIMLPFIIGLGLMVLLMFNDLFPGITLYNILKTPFKADGSFYEKT